MSIKSTSTIKKWPSCVIHKTVTLILTLRKWVHLRVSWWTRRGSNPRPYGCEPYALPDWATGPNQQFQKQNRKTKQYEIIGVAENRTLCAPNRATGPNALSKTILYQENLKSKVFFEEKTGKILEAGREIEKPCVKNRKRSERFLRELLDSFGKMMYNTSQQSARYRIGVGHGRTSRGDSGALYLQSAVAGMNPGPPEASCFVSCR